VAALRHRDGAIRIERTHRLLERLGKVAFEATPGPAKMAPSARLGRDPAIAPAL